MKIRYNFLRFSMAFCCLILLQLVVAQRVVVNQNGNISANVVVGQQRYHISESLYTEQEIGAGNFLSAATAIDKIAFFVKNTGIPASIAQVRILMKEVPSSLQSLGVTAYTVTGYTTVFSGTLQIDTVGPLEIPLSTPFIRTSGKNLMVMVERLDAINHYGFVFATSNGLESNAGISSSRRYNDSIPPVLGSTLISPTVFRPAISFIHVFPSDVAVTAIVHPDISCFDTVQTVQVAIQNQGTNSVSAGNVQVFLNFNGANVSAHQAINQRTLLPGETEEVIFDSVPLSATGLTLDTAFIVMSGDGTTYNDTLTSALTTASVLSSFPMLENMENTLTVFPYFTVLSGDRLLWRLHTNKYSNADMTPDSLRPQSPGIRYMLFDSWSAPVSDGFSSRIFSNCIQLPSPTINGLPVTTVSFLMSHDTLFSANADSLYLSISNNQGVTWNRLQGFARWEASAVTPRWTNHQVDITAYDGQLVQLGFEGVSKYGNAFGLDNINIKYTNPVPLTLLEFKAFKKEKTNQLTWTTAKESNMFGFDVERSGDGWQFESIGGVLSSGDGSYRTYAYEDIKPLSGIQYYRLRMINADHTFTYSPIQKIERPVSLQVHIENPVTAHQLRVVASTDISQDANIIIQDVQGKLLMNSNWTIIAGQPNRCTIPVQLSAGHYTVTIKTKTQTTAQWIVVP